MNYTLITYRPNCDDYCRGCYMGGSDSEFDMFFSTDFEQIENEYFRLELANVQRRGYEFASNDYHLLINGDPDYYYEASNVYCCDFMEVLRNEVGKKVDAEVLRLKQVELEAKQLEKEKFEKIAKEKQEKADRDNYERLKMKFEN